MNRLCIEISQLRLRSMPFFDKVMVMVEDESCVRNRLACCRRWSHEFSSIADFSEIVTERK